MREMARGEATNGRRWPRTIENGQKAGLQVAWCDFANLAPQITRIIVCEKLIEPARSGDRSGSDSHRRGDGGLTPRSPPMRRRRDADESASQKRRVLRVRPVGWSGDRGSSAASLQSRSVHVEGAARPRNRLWRQRGATAKVDDRTERPSDRTRGGRWRARAAPTDRPPTVRPPSVERPFGRAGVTDFVSREQAPTDETRASVGSWVGRSVGRANGRSFARPEARQSCGSQAQPVGLSQSLSRLMQLSPQALPFLQTLQQAGAGAPMATGTHANPRPSAKAAAMGNANLRDCFTRASYRTCCEGGSVAAEQSHRAQSKRDGAQLGR